MKHIPNSKKRDIVKCFKAVKSEINPPQKLWCFKARPE
uniref:Uncharacterized protein n=1 Tax=Anguilla anguilla TaxID=7936 RepID=A0A0E9T8J3_ANGAN